ncbi:GNAT family protein [Paraburkholderia phytofirmans]|jgi:RimJ/RimL family protein N-acetyltransferase|uniref:GNAT family N-acetyltransferase n=1 Tax=Paraburkholderia sp. BL9I2N2 TaxID=1938809 RepID=UPI00104FD35D|nr:GNAT family protein [Paraburkholderia sp. BL9I2N2]TCK91402.1 RimJ/RimL family protein N-acetyltransferase [Paraburkholderia sp. BL9I2N2]
MHLNDNAVLVRQLGPNDRDDYFQLRLRGLKAHPDSFGQSYEEALAKGASQHEAMLKDSRAAEGDFLLGAYASAGTPLIGVVGLIRNPSDKQRHKAAVIGMYVAPEAAGRGVGRALLNELLARASRVEGLRQIQLLVGSRNEAARKLYESFGFRKYGCEVGALNVGGVFHDADLMALFI